MEFHVHGGPAVVSGVLQALGESAALSSRSGFASESGWGPEAQYLGRSPRQVARATASRGRRVH